MTNNKLETSGSAITMNLNNVIYKNIISSPYFKYLMELTAYQEVLDEVYKKVTFLEPFFKGTNASSAFCILYRLWTLKLTVKQLSGLLRNSNAYVRGIGLLYLRYVCKPVELYDWFEPHLDDEQPIKVEAHVHVKSITIGRLSRDLLVNQKFHGTVLPRIPVLIAKEIEEKIKQRSKQVPDGDVDEGALEGWESPNRASRYALFPLRVSHRDGLGLGEHRSRSPLPPPSCSRSRSPSRSHQHYHSHHHRRRHQRHHHHHHRPRSRSNSRDTPRQRYRSRSSSRDHKNHRKRSGRLSDRHRRHSSRSCAPTSRWPLSSRHRSRNNSLGAHVSCHHRQTKDYCDGARNQNGSIEEGEI